VVVYLGPGNRELSLLDTVLFGITFTDETLNEFLLFLAQYAIIDDREVCRYDAKPSRRGGVWVERHGPSGMLRQKCSSLECT
jgi:hypothetical protein